MYIKLFFLMANLFSIVVAFLHSYKQYMSSRCSTCSLTLGMVHQYHFSQSLRFIAVSHSGFNLHFCIIIDADHLLCTYWPFYISCFCSFLIVLSFFFNEWSEFFSSFSIFPFILPTPFYPSEPFFFSH